jgi:hypothetical protein
VISDRNIINNDYIFHFKVKYNSNLKFWEKMYETVPGSIMAKINENKA